MNEDTSKKKELIINGILYAHYIIENGMLYIKVRKDIVKGKKGVSEDYLVDLICLLEKKKGLYVSYLNIK